MPVGRRLVGGRRAQQQTLLERAAHELHRDRHVIDEPDGDRQGRRARQHPHARVPRQHAGHRQRLALRRRRRVPRGARDQQEVATRERVEHTAPPCPLPFASTAVMRAADRLAAAQPLQDVVGEDLRAVAQTLAVHPGRLGEQQLGGPLDRLVEARQLGLHELRAQPLELCRGRLQARPQVGVEFVLPAAEHADPQAADAQPEAAGVVADGGVHGDGVVVVVAGDDVQHHRDVLRPARQRSDRVEGPRHRDRAPVAHAPGRGPQTAAPVERGRDPHGAPGVGPQRRGREVRADRRARASARAAADARDVPRVVDVAVVDVLVRRTDRPLGHAELAEEHRARVAQALVDGRVLVRDDARAVPRPRGHLEAADRDVVLQRDRDAGQRAERPAGTGRLVDRRGLLERQLAGDGAIHVQRGIERVDAIEVRLGEADRGQLARADGGRRPGDRAVRWRRRAHAASTRVAVASSSTCTSSRSDPISTTVLRAITSTGSCAASRT